MNCLIISKEDSISRSFLFVFKKLATKNLFDLILKKEEIRLKKIIEFPRNKLVKSLSISFMMIMRVKKMRYIYLHELHGNIISCQEISWHSIYQIYRQPFLHPLTTYTHTLTHTKKVLKQKERKRKVEGKGNLSQT